MIPYGMPIEVVSLWLFIFGAVIGSFLNVCIYRIAVHDRIKDQLRALLYPPSTCPRCQSRIPGVDNIPIFGWLKLRGRCRSCRLPIPIRYPAIELMNGLLFVLVYWMEVPSSAAEGVRGSCLFHVYGPQYFHNWTWGAAEFLNLRFLYHLVLIEALVVASFIDIDTWTIPDGSTLPAMLVGIVGAAAIGQVHIVPVWFSDASLVRGVADGVDEWFALFASGLPDFIEPLLGPVVLWAGSAFAWWLDLTMTARDVPSWIGEHQHLHGLFVSMAGLVIGGGFVWIVRIIGAYVLRREAMGFGDVILMGMIGSFIGWQPVMIVFFLAPMCALAIVLTRFALRRETLFPYGPYLSLGTLLVMLGWRQIWPLAERFFSMGPLLPFLGLMMVGMLFLSLRLVQSVKRLLGIPLYPVEEVFEEWPSANQLLFFEGEKVDDQQGLWRQQNRWQGIDAGRGQQYVEQWRNPK